MLRNTFLHLRGISLAQEKKLWKQGITTWEAYERHFDCQLSLFDSKESTFSESRYKLEKDDTPFFSERLPVSEYFRIALDYPEDTLFLDIETTGSGYRFDQITVVGWSLGQDFGFYIDGDDPTPMLEAINKSKAVVTFNGSTFDLPIVRKAFPEASFPTCHLDLRFMARRAGLKGGQKRIEKAIGMYREDDILDMTGMQAPLLWHEYQQGNEEALRTLVRYNYADVYGMKVILDYLIQEILNDYPIVIDKPYPFAKDKGLVPERFLKIEV